MRAADHNGNGVNSKEILANCRLRLPPQGRPSTNIMCGEECQLVLPDLGEFLN